MSAFANSSSARSHSIGESDNNIGSGLAGMMFFLFRYFGQLPSYRLSLGVS